MEKLIEEIIQFNKETHGAFIILVLAAPIFFYEVCKVFKKLYLEEKNNLLLAFFLAIIYCIVSIGVRGKIPAKDDYLRRQPILLLILFLGGLAIIGLSLFIVHRLA